MKDNEMCWCKSGIEYALCHKEFDKKLEELKKQGKIIPPKKLIKTQEQIEGIREAGRINSLILDKVAENIKEGMSTEEIDKIVFDETKRLGGRPAPLGYCGFPKSVCTSVNSVVCHGIPNKKHILKAGDIVNVDCTTEVNGYYGDASRMFIIGEASEEAKKLVTKTKEILDFAFSKLKPFMTVGDIGHWVNKLARANGFSVVKELGGHGVGLAMHEDPFVNHTAKLGTGMIIAPGMVFTIEPMINAGRAGVYIDGVDGWTVRTQDNSLTAQWEYTILMTETGAEILSK